MQNKTVALKEYLHKVSDVYHNNYLMQCLKLIYVDVNRSQIYQRQLSPWYITLSLQQLQARSYSHANNIVHDFTCW